LFRLLIASARGRFNLCLQGRGILYPLTPAQLNLTKYRGIYKNLRFDLEGEIEKLRDEWIRE